MLAFPVYIQKSHSEKETQAGQEGGKDNTYHFILEDGTNQEHKNTTIDALPEDALTALFGSLAEDDRLT